MGALRHVHDLLHRQEAVHGLRDESLAPDPARPFDLPLPVAAGGLGLLQEALVGVGQHGVPKSDPGAGTSPFGR